MAGTTLYLGDVGAGKSTLMRSHVDQLRQDEDAPLFFVVDHDDTWDLPGVRVYSATAEWWTEPALVSVFRGPGPREVAQLAIDVGWAVYVDDEVDLILGDGWKFSPLREIVKRGRHLKNRAGAVCEVSAMIATHRPSNLPQDVIGCFERVYLGRLHGDADADRVRREGWLNGSRQDVATALRARAPGEFSVWPA